MQRVLAIGSTVLFSPSWRVATRSCTSAIYVRLGRGVDTCRTATTLNFQELDEKWQKRWSEGRETRKDNGKKKSYVLAMFPYPSGALHMGHVRVYTIADVLARFQRMQGQSKGKEVIYPMGWDAFGLPAENAAIERGLDPSEWTRSNIGKMKEQLQGMNTDMDWDRELITCSPEFYKHTQRVFLLLHEHGLAYQAQSLVNYDPVDRTVLANEQVDSNGCSWRSGARVEKLNLKQWFLKITNYREQLLDDLQLLKKWPDRVVAMQQNWIGRSRGTKVTFPVWLKTTGVPSLRSISVFTTRLDTLPGVQFLALSVDHPLVVELAAKDSKLQAFIDKVPNLSEDSKVGFCIREAIATNPVIDTIVNPGPEFKDLPEYDDLSIWVAPYVKGNYGEGAVMGVPAHDERDLAFWRANYGKKKLRSVVGAASTSVNKTKGLQQAFTSQGILLGNCAQYAGLTSQQADEQMYKDLAKTNWPAERQERWRLRDWLISRQRYWGAPIPIIHCKTCGPVPVPVEDLPVELPKLDPETFKHRKGNPLETAEEWVNVPCPKCKAPARRDTDTMDTFVDSSWYMFRFADPYNTEQPFGIEKANEIMPVDTYVGGIEHAILHLLYARFIGKFLADIGMWPAGQAPEIRGEPFRQLISQGMVHGKTYSDPTTGRFLKPEELDLSNPSRPLIKAIQQPPNVSFEKMSKSKYNGIDPTDVISRYGADVSRVHMLFQAPVSDVLEWEEARIIGVQRWLVRLHKYIEAISNQLSKTKNSPSGSASLGLPVLSDLTQDQVKIYLSIQRTISSITTALSKTHALNTCISDLMTLTNTLTSTKDPLPRELLYHASSTIIKLLGPFAPAFSEECWELLHQNLIPSGGTLFEQPWPVADNLVALEEWAATNLRVPCAINENGKLRMVLEFEPMPADIEGNEEKSIAWVLEQMSKFEKGREWLESKKAAGGWSRIIVVKGGKGVNFVGGKK